MNTYIVRLVKSNCEILYQKTIQAKTAEEALFIISNDINDPNLLIHYTNEYNCLIVPSWQIIPVR